MRERVEWEREERRQREEGRRKRARERGGIQTDRQTLKRTDR